MSFYIDWSTCLVTEWLGWFIEVKPGSDQIGTYLSKIWTMPSLRGTKQSLLGQRKSAEDRRATARDDAVLPLLVSK